MLLDELVYTELYLFFNPLALLLVVVATDFSVDFKNITERTFFPQSSVQRDISQAKKEKQHLNGQRVVGMRISAGKLL